MVAGNLQTQTHICLISDFCLGGELFLLLERQPRKVFTEDVVRFYAAEIVIALEYLHCVGKDSYFPPCTPKINRVTPVLKSLQ